MNSKIAKTIWFTGLSGSGKTTLATLVIRGLKSLDLPVVLMDGDLMRAGLNRDLGFSTEDRVENIRRAGEVAKILVNAGVTVVAAFITPWNSLRESLRQLFEPGQYLEIFLDCPLVVCEERDPKGLYRRARSGVIPDFTGVSSAFHRPVRPDLIVPTGEQTVGQSVTEIFDFLRKSGYAQLDEGSSMAESEVDSQALAAFPAAGVSQTGQSVESSPREPEQGYTSEEEELIRKRLMDLGYL